MRKVEPRQTYGRRTGRRRAWGVPATGGTVLDRWPGIAAAIAPQPPDHVAAVAFHPETGQLDLRPDSPAYATLRTLD
ncbi:hypothetical protein [Streptomyces sp. NPDC051132]|uniref:hypothetical protein n=1 Tax=unclassified Streptomyces TaxID=2593676 RepID=UPI00344255F6